MNFNNSGIWSVQGRIIHVEIERPSVFEEFTNTLILAANNSVGIILVKSMCGNENLSLMRSRRRPRKLVFTLSSIGRSIWVHSACKVSFKSSNTRVLYAYWCVLVFPQKKYLVMHKLMDKGCYEMAENLDIGQSSTKGRRMPVYILVVWAAIKHSETTYIE